MGFIGNSNQMNIVGSITALGLLFFWLYNWLIWSWLPPEHSWKRRWPTRPMPLNDWIEHATPALLQICFAMGAVLLMLFALFLNLLWIWICQ